MRLAISLFLVWIAHFLVDFMLGVWSVYKTMAAIDLGLAGVIAATAAFAGEGAQVIFGSLSDRGYGRRLIVFGVLMTAANILLALTTNTFLIFTLFLTACLGSGAFHPSAVSFVGSLTERQKGLFIAFFASGGSLGMAISQFVFAKTHVYFEGNTTPLLVPSFLVALIMIFWGFFTKESPMTKEKTVLNFNTIRAYFRHHPFRMLYLMQVCNQTLFWGTIFLLPDLLVARGYSSNIAFGGGHFAFIIGSVITVIPLGFLADKLSPRKVILASSLIGMAAFIFFLAIPTLEPTWLLIALFISGAFLGVVQPLAVALGNVLGRNNPGLVSSFTMGLVWCVSETIGPLGAGFLASSFVEDAPAKALLIFSLLFPILLFAAWQLPEAEEQEALVLVREKGVE